MATKKELTRWRKQLPRAAEMKKHLEEIAEGIRKALLTKMEANNESDDDV